MQQQQQKASFFAKRSFDAAENEPSSPVKSGP